SCGAGVIVQQSAEPLSAPNRRFKAATYLSKETAGRCPCPGDGPPRGSAQGIHSARAEAIPPQTGSVRKPVRSPSTEPVPAGVLRFSKFPDPDFVLVERGLTDSLVRLGQRRPANTRGSFCRQCPASAD